MSLLATLCTPFGAFASPPGAVISNQASFEFRNLAGELTTVQSNEVSVVTAVVRSPSTVSFTRVVTGNGGLFQETVGPAACLQGGAYVVFGDPLIVGGGSIDPSQTHEVTTTATYNSGESAFLRLADSDQNRDYQVVEYADVQVDSAGDSEVIRLTETGADTGVFAGYVPLSSDPPVGGDCVLQGMQDTTIVVGYTDPADADDSATASAQLDPVQRVFESRSGTVVSGSTIEIVAAASGLPATVYGNDGVSLFPSSITSGGTVTDSSGTVYVFGPGEYRFPVVPDGDYRLVVTAPAQYTAPSSVSIVDLQALPGAPYRLSPASFGAAFSKTGALSTAIDIPLDPLASDLFLQKRTMTTIAAPGDFVRYELMLQNASTAGVANSITVADQLPPHVRFVPGSVTIDGNSAPDPLISQDARTLTFPIDSLAEGVTTKIYYVVEIVGGDRDDELVNTAVASADGGLVSNEASAMIRLTEDLFRTSGTIIGRVLEGDCSQDTFGEEQGVANVRIYLEDGRFAVTDAGGRFHFEGVEPGTHVAQLDTFTVPEYFDIMGCEDTPGYAGRAESQFVKLSRGSLQRADFYLRRKAPPEGRIDIEMRNAGADSAEQVAYEVTLNGVGNVEIDNISLMLVLPKGVHYEAGSLRLDGAEVGEPHLVGPSVSMALDGQFGNWTSKVGFVATIDDNVDGELVTKALAKFDTPMSAKQKTPVVETRMIREPAVVENAGYVLDLKFAVLSDELSVQDKAQLDALINEWQGVRNIQLSATGHSDSQRIKAANRHLFADNYVLSRARAMSAAFYIADALDVDIDNIQVEGRGPDDPVASNATAAGRQKNRRVELVISGLRPKEPSFLEMTQKSSGVRETPTVGAVPGMQESGRKRYNEDSEAGLPSSQKEPPMDSLLPGYAMLLPEKDYAPAIPSSKVSVQHKPEQTVELTLNGLPVSNLNFDGVATNGAETIAISRWVGVNLVDGANELRAVVRNADGSKAKGIRRTIHFSGTPIRAEIVEDLSVLVADGKTSPVIAVRLFDRTGNPSRTGVVGQFRVNAPYRSAWDEEHERKNALVETGDRSATYRVDGEGIAYLELAPTTRTGEVTVVLPFENYREQEVRAWLKPAQRDWILVGFAEGTVGYNTLSKNASAAAAAGHEDEYYDDGRIAFFAKGSIKGEYLLTLAYDSDRDRDRNRFDTIVDPAAYYTLYADTSEQRFDAASQRNLYVKLERNQFYALFGDFDTGLSVTDLARYDRRFNGFKSEYRGENVGYSVFAAESDQSFNRDEMRGDGTSGLYRLSRAPVIANSELIRIEVRDRFDSGIVLSSTRLTRFLDYNLDTLDGTLYFKKPVPSRDLDFNPVYIVIEYESLAAESNDLVAGGRGSLRFADDSVEVGLTHIDDATSGAEADLTGVDLRWQVNPETLVRAEIVETNATIGGLVQDGKAHKVEVEHSSENLDLRAFIREVDEGFGLGYQSAADQGARRVGLDARARVGNRFMIEGEAGWQQNLQTEAIRNVARAQLRYDRDAFTARAGLSHAEDQFDDGDTRSSDLAEVGLTQSLLDGELKLRFSGSTALGDDAGNLDFPTRYVFGADYAVSDGVDVVAEYEEADGRDLDASMTRVGVRATPWSRAQINSFLTNETTEFGPRLFANVGLIQGFQLNERWIFDVGVDHANTIVDAEARQFDEDRELSSGSFNDDFTAAFVGAMYTSDLWSANGRIETRNSDSEERLSVLAGWYRQPSRGHGLSAGFTMFQADNALGNEMTQANLRFGWAYRLADRDWSFLDRVDLVYDQALLADDEQSSWRLINNFNANRRISAATSLSLQYAFKYVRSQFDDDGYTGYTDLVGVDIRHGFDSRWDIGANASVLHSYESGTMDYGVGVDVGFNLAANVWLSLGYNFAGFDDDDFDDARYTAQGPFLRFSIKTDQHLLKRIAGQ